MPLISHCSAEALGLSNGAADDVAEACIQSFCSALQDFSDTDDELETLDFARYYSALVLEDFDAFRVALAADPML